MASTAPLRWGFLGAGWIADIIAKDFKIAGLTIVAVAARDGAKASEFAATHGIPKSYSGYDALVGDPDVDIVYASTTQNWHFRDALRVINAGKHLLLEKPFTLDASEAEEIVAAAAAKGVFLMEAMWTRFLPSMVAAKAVLKSGVIGTPNMAIADHSQFLTAVPRLWENRLGGGALLDLGVYPISFIMSIFGVPSSVHAAGVVNASGIDEMTSAVLHFADKRAQGVVSCSLTNAGPITASVLCSNGRLDMDKSFYEHTSFRVYDNAGTLLQSYTDKIEGRGMQYEAIHVEECIRAGLLQSPVMPLSESVEIMKVMDEVRKQTGVTFKTRQE